MTEETRAEIARRRLAQLAATFETEFSEPAAAPPAATAPGHRARSRPTRGRGGPAGLAQGHLRAVVVVAVAATVLLTWWLIGGRTRQSSASEPLSLTPSASAQNSTVGGSTAGSSTAGSSATATASASAGTQIVVDVVGKVRHPGIVTLAAGARVHEAIAAAGGTTGRNVDTSNLNLARKLTDGEQIVVGATTVASAPASGQASGATGAGAASGGLVNINTADLTALDTLPGIGPVTAQAIIDWRTKNGSFTSVDDLLEVKGIGEATLADIRDRVTV